MLSFFRVNDPYRILGVLVIIVLIRLPFYLWGDVTSIYDLKLFLIGEKIASGSWLYSDILTDTPPLLGMLYGLIYLIFGNSVAILHILSFLLVCFQILLFNTLISQNKATNTQTYIPGLIYGILISLTPDLYTLNPFILSNTFILLSLHSLFNHLELRVKRDEKILLIGIYMSISCLFFSGFIFFMPAVFLLLVVYTNTIFKRYLLLLYGFLLPFLLLLVPFIIKRDLNPYLEYLFNLQWHSLDFQFNWNLSLYVYSIFTALSLVVIILKGRFTNFQNTLIFSMILWFLLAIFIWAGFNGLNSGTNILLLVPVAFFTMHLFNILKPGLWSTLFFLVFITTSVLSNIYFWKWDKDFPDTEMANIKHQLPSNPYFDEVKGKKILVFSGKWDYYYGAGHSGKIFNPNLIKVDFSVVNYESIALFYETISSSWPEVIIDENHQLENYFSRIPELKAKYIPDPNKNLWRLTGS